MVTARRLDFDGNGVGNELRGMTGADGAMSLQVPVGWNDAPALVQVEGVFRDEVSGSCSPEPLRLQGILQIERGRLVGNVNLFTHLFAVQVAARMRETRKGYECARNWVLKGPFRLWLGIGMDPAWLNPVQPIEGLEAESGKLLLFSISFLEAGLGQAQLDEMADDLTRDFMGRFDNESNFIEPVGYRHFNRVLSGARLQLYSRGT